MNGHNLKNSRRETSRTFRTKKREYLKGKINELETNNKTKILAKFKYLGTTLTNQNDIHDEIKIRLNSGNACSYTVKNLLFSGLISKNLKIKI
jgi:hypothetical protein